MPAIVLVQTRAAGTSTWTLATVAPAPPEPTAAASSASGRATRGRLPSITRMSPPSRQLPDGRTSGAGRLSGIVRRSFNRPWLSRTSGPPSPPLPRTRSRSACRPPAPARLSADTGIDREVGAAEAVRRHPRALRLEAATDLLLHLQPDGVEARGEAHAVPPLLVRRRAPRDSAVAHEDERDVLGRRVARLLRGADRHDRAAHHEAAQAARARGRTRRRDGDERDESGEKAHLDTG